MDKRIKGDALHYLLIASIGGLFTLPAIIYGIPFQSDDGALHSLWYKNFSEQLWSGNLYPRWLMNMNAGLGSPVFFYYPPVPYFFTSILKPFFKSDPQGYHQLGLSASLALVASGLAAYLWLKKTDQRTALIAATLYMTMPYHLAADLYLRGAFTEFWAFIWMPLILFFTDKTARGERLAPIGLAVSYALLIMTHLPTTLMFSPIPPAYIGVTETKSRFRKARTVAASMLLGVGLSAAYLLPAMTTQGFVFLDRMNIGFFSYKNWFLGARMDLWKEDKIEIALLVFGMTALAYFAFSINRRALKGHQRRVSEFWFAVALCSVLMMTGLSQMIWAAIPVLQKIQFPWRFNAILALATTALLAQAIARARNLSPVNGRRIILLLLIAVWMSPVIWSVWEAYPEIAPDWNTISDNNEKVNQSRDAPEYRPRWSRSMAEMDWDLSLDINHWDHLLDEEFTSLLAQNGALERGSNKIHIINGEGQVLVTNWQPGEIFLRVASHDGISLSVEQFYFPYWTAQLVGESASVPISDSQPSGLINLSVPGGTHTVRLRLERSRPESIGQFITLLSAITTLLIACLRLSYPARRSSLFKREVEYEPPPSNGDCSHPSMELSVEVSNRS